MALVTGYGTLFFLQGITAKLFSSSLFTFQWVPAANPCQMLPKSPSSKEPGIGHVIFLLHKSVFESSSVMLYLAKADNEIGNTA
jgi:hypothetical protein